MTVERLVTLFMLVNSSCVFVFQTIRKVLLAYAEIVRKDFEKYTAKHQVVSTRLQHIVLCHMKLYNLQNINIWSRW